VHPTQPRQDAEIIGINSKLRITPEILSQCPSLRLVITTTSGYDHIDLGLLRSREISAVRLPMPRRDAVCDTSLGMIIQGFRQSGVFRTAASNDVWGRALLSEMAMRTISGAVIGVVGTGVIGTRMCEVLRLLGAKILACDPSGVPEGVEEATIAEMMARCDAVSLHCHAQPNGAPIIDGSTLRSARPGLVLVNTARGSLVDLQAAVYALDRGILGALMVDVFTTEPWGDLAASVDRANLVYTPHAAGYHDRLCDMIRDDLYRVIRAFIHSGPLPWDLMTPNRA